MPIAATSNHCNHYAQSLISWQVRAEVKLKKCPRFEAGPCPQQTDGKSHPGAALHEGNGAQSCSERSRRAARAGRAEHPAHHRFRLPHGRPSQVGMGTGTGMGGGPGALKGRRCLRGAGLEALKVPVPGPCKRSGVRLRRSPVPGKAERGDPGWQRDGSALGGQVLKMWESAERRARQCVPAHGRSSPAVCRRLATGLGAGLGWLPAGRGAGAGRGMGQGMGQGMGHLRKGPHTWALTAQQPPALRARRAVFSHLASKRWSKS